MIEDIYSHTELEEANVPRPHYLLDDTIHVDIDRESERGIVTADLVFPPDDQDVIDRLDHVNIASHQFAAWNAAHLLCNEIGVERPRVQKLEATAKHVTMPNERLHLEAVVKVIEDRKRLLVGSFNAKFYGGDPQKLYEELTAYFYAKKKL